MLITRQSQWSGVIRTLDIPVTNEQLQKWKQGELIQRAMPNLSDNEREFLMTGITAEEWEDMWRDTEEEDA